MLKIRRSWDRLIFNMGILILLYIKTAPWFLTLNEIHECRSQFPMWIHNHLQDSKIWIQNMHLKHYTAKSSCNLGLSILHTEKILQTLGKLLCTMQTWFETSALIQGNKRTKHTLEIFIDPTGIPVWHIAIKTWSSMYLIALVMSAFPFPVLHCSHMGAMASRIANNSTVCSTACWN